MWVNEWGGFKECLEGALAEDTWQNIEGKKRGTASKKKKVFHRPKIIIKKCEAVLCKTDACVWRVRKGTNASGSMLNSSV